MLLSAMFAEIAESLTPENWIKGDYFIIRFDDLETDDHLCMCAHGAVQARVNDEVKKLLAYSNMSPSVARAACRDVGIAIQMGQNAAQAIAFGKESTQEAWDSRTFLIKDNVIAGNRNYGNVDAHFLCGLVGLTIDFNDAPTTTLAMVQEKFRAASKLAESLGV